MPPLTTAGALSIRSRSPSSSIPSSIPPPPATEAAEPATAGIMPTAKKLRSVGLVNEPKSSPQSASRSPNDAVVRPTASGIQDEQSGFVKAARAHWLKPTRKNAQIKVKNDVLKKDIWEPLERDGFPYKLLLELESLSILESYIWPGFNEGSPNIQVLLIALVANVKRREHVDIWSLFGDRPAEFSSLFRRVLALTLDTTQPTSIRTQLICFLIHAFQSLDCAPVRKECAPLVSISIWHNLSSEALRETKLSLGQHVRKAWRASLKRYDAADDANKARLRFDRSWLYTLVLEFIGLLYAEDPRPSDVVYCERLTEFLCDLQSQLPTRRYVNSLLQDLHVLSAMKLSPMFGSESNGLLREMHTLLAEYTSFIVDDQTGGQLSRTETYDRHCKILGHLQHVAFRYFKDELTVLALSNYGSIDKREDLAALLEPLSDERLVELAGKLDIRTSYPESLNLPVGRQLILEILLSTFERKKSFREAARSTALVPTEASLFDNSFLRTDSYNGSHPLGLPKLNLQYLSVGDFLWRAFVLYRCESFYAIKRDVELAVSRLRAGRSDDGQVRFYGTSRMALPCSKASVLQVVPPLVGEDHPAEVRAEISYDLRRSTDIARRDWDALRPDDVVFLLSVQPPAPKQSSSSSSSSSSRQQDALPDGEALGVTCVRTAEVVQIQDDEGRYQKSGLRIQGSRRKMILKLDSPTYTRDLKKAAAAAAGVYDSINVVLRRQSRENNFKRVLEAIRVLMLSDVPLPSWIHEVFLGYGDPAGATYKHLPNRVRSIDFRDTFLDWQHLIEGLPGKVVEPGGEASGSFPPPYVLETVETPPRDGADAKPSKKRRRDAEPALIADVETVKVSTYKPPNLGPYPTDAPKLNSVRFTPAQIEAITSGTQPGLTVIVGPPGTGKTDVATQIISNIYHNFPHQRTLLVAHSNQALNQLFAKIVALDISERHLLRLGHGEDELDTDASFSKHGRVESFMENRNRYLLEVTRLAAGIGAPGAHGNSAETAGYFRSVYVAPRWAQFEQVMEAPGSSSADIAAAFPFHAYFADAPQPLFPPDASRESAVETARGCYRHISTIFSELEDALPFELLRREKDRTNYLLTNEARIVAMTSTHAAMRRSEIAALGFHYDNIVMEEAAQVTEAESFIPLAMQRPTDGEMPLQRVVLCGDHLQNSPVIQNSAFRHYANMEQSLFSRLVRLGVPAVHLDQQGRARASIAALYRWRYPSLGNLPHVLTSAEYRTANAGFKYDYQFVDVPDYKGRGEAEPSPHFIQNPGEAEYAVAIYQYMRLLGYPAAKITILTTYAGQRALVRDVLTYRCAKSPVFGMPRAVATVDKYQGEQNDYIILSLTRTTRVGYLRDVRRMTVALSRARLGLYILGRREVFESCHELSPAFSLLLRRPDKLMLVTGEMWPSQRSLGEEDGGDAVPGEAPMESVEHLGQFVYEMTNVKLGRTQGVVAVTDQDHPLGEGSGNEEMVGANDGDGAGAGAGVDVDSAQGGRDGEEKEEAALAEAQAGENAD